MASIHDPDVYSPTRGARAKAENWWSTVDRTIPQLAATGETPTVSPRAPDGFSPGVFAEDSDVKKFIEDKIGFRPVRAGQLSIYGKIFQVDELKPYIKRWIESDDVLEPKFYSDAAHRAFKPIVKIQLLGARNRAHGGKIVPLSPDGVIDKNRKFAIARRESAIHFRLSSAPPVWVNVTEHEPGELPNNVMYDVKAHVPTFYASGIVADPSLSFTVMEFIKGQTLSEFMHPQRVKFYTPETLLNVQEALAHAMACLYLNGVAHMDLHIGNIMVQHGLKDPTSARHGGYRVIIIDFGNSAVMNPEFAEKFKKLLQRYKGDATKAAVAFFSFTMDGYGRRSVDARIIRRFMAHRTQPLQYWPNSQALEHLSRRATAAATAAAAAAAVKKRQEALTKKLANAELVRRRNAEARAAAARAAARQAENARVARAAHPHPVGNQNAATVLGKRKTENDGKKQRKTLWTLTQEELKKGAAVPIGRNPPVVVVKRLAASNAKRHEAAREAKAAANAAAAKAAANAANAAAKAKAHANAKAMKNAANKGVQRQRRVKTPTEFINLTGTTPAASRRPTPDASRRRPSSEINLTGPSP